MKKTITLVVTLQFFMIYLAIEYSRNATINGPSPENGLIEWGAIGVHLVIAIILRAIIVTPTKAVNND